MRENVYCGAFYFLKRITFDHRKLSATYINTAKVLRLTVCNKTSLYTHGLLILNFHNRPQK